MKFLTLPVLFFFGALANASSLDGAVCRPADGTREMTMNFQQDGRTVTLLSDFGNKSHAYKIDGNILTVSLFSGNSASFTILNGGMNLEPVGTSFFGKYNCIK